MIVGFFVITCKKQFREDIIGTLFIIIGAGIVIGDPMAARVGEEINMAVSFLSLLGNIPGALFWILSKKCNDYIDPKSKLVYLNWCQVLYNIIASFIYDKSDFFSITKGVFGYLPWTSFYQTIFVNFFLCGFLAGFWGISGYVWATEYFSDIVVMNTLLLEPFLSQVIGVMINIDKPPGAMTIIGVLIVFIANNYIAYTKKKRQVAAFEDALS